MALPMRDVSGRPVFGPTAAELHHSQHVTGSSFSEAISERSMRAAGAESTNLFALPLDTPDNTLLAFGLAFPHEDFGRSPTSQPHAAAVAARSASINEILRNIEQMTEQARKFITLVGPSPAQYKKIATRFPNSEVTVFQPTATSRDISRWRHNIKDIHDGLWTQSSAVRADIVIALFSVGCFHPEQFAKSCIAASSSLAYVLHHWSAQSLIGEHLDPILGLKFVPSGESIRVAYNDSPSYTDSRECTRAWLTADFRVPGHGFFCDQLVDFSTMQLLKISIAPGITEEASCTRFDFLSKHKVLPATEGFPDTVISVRLWESTLDYASRQNPNLLTTLIIRNRISSLQHKVSIGKSVIQEALFCTDAIAHHLSLITVEVMRLRAHRAEVLESRVERGLRAKQSPAAALSSLNERSYGTVRTAEVLARAAVNSWLWAPSLLLKGELLAVSPYSSIPSTSAPTMLERIEDRLDTSNDRIAFLSRNLDQCIPRSVVETSAFYSKARVWKNEKLVPFAVENARNLVAVLVTPLPFEARYKISALALWILDREGAAVPLYFRRIRALIRGFAHAIPQGRLLVDAICDAFANYFGWDRSEADRVRNWAQNVQPPTESSAFGNFPPSEHPSDASSSDSSHSSDDPAAPVPPTYAAPSMAEEGASASDMPAAPSVNQEPPPADDDNLDAAPEMQVHEENERAIGQTHAVPEAEPVQLEKGIPHTFSEKPDLSRPLSSPITDRDTILDRASKLTPAKKDYSMGSANKFPNIGVISAEITVGPNTLRLAIAKALGMDKHTKVGDYARDYLRTNCKAIRDSPEKRKKGETVEQAQFSSNIATILSKPPTLLRKFDAVVDGLPAAGKSSMLRYVLCSQDVIVVPTAELARKWKADLLNWKIKAEVLTQHKLLLSDTAHDKYRLLVIDEAFLFEVNHLAHLRQFARYAIALGDQGQIAAFNVRKHLSAYPITKGFAKVWINAPFSLGLPVDVLALGKRLGFAAPEALTYNKTQALEYVHDNLPFSAPPRLSLNICFNQEHTVKDVVITAHAAQGSRPKVAYVRVAPSEANFCPLSGQFWVAITRATFKTKLYLCETAKESLRQATVSSVNGFLRTRALPDAITPIGDIAHESCMHKLQNASTAGMIAELGLSTDTIEFQTRDICTSYETPLRADGFQLTKQEIDSALLSINCNFEGRKYKDVVSDAELVMPKDITQPLSIVLDLQAGQKEATSTLEKAGVYFTSDDTKTEFFTIATRYLSQHPVKSDDPERLARLLLHSFETAFIDPAKTSATSLPAAAHLNAWIASRTPSLFQPDTSVFGEEAHTVTFSSFLKAHAKAKNEAGFGTKIEKGQTIAAGHQSYNTRHTAYCRELQSVLPQLTYDSVFLDIGFSDEEFESFCAEQDAFGEVNTQIDLSSQDSTHFEHHVLMFVMLLLKYTSMPESAALEYLEMRRKFTVRAKSFSNSQSMRYSVSWNLPSGDPYTLVANTIMEACSMAYIFAIEPSRLEPIAFKGDDTYTKMLLILTSVAQIKMGLVGVVLKLDHCLPPFFAGRYILPSNAVFHDPIKHAAKYSVKRFDPTKVPEYVQAYRILLRDASPYEDELLIMYGVAHHPSITTSDQRILMIFARSLKTYPGFLRFQNFSGLSAQYVDPPTDCIPAVFGALHLPKPPTSAPALALVRFCNDKGIDHAFLPNASRHALRDYAALHPNKPVFNWYHVLTFLSETRYSQVPSTF